MAILFVAPIEKLGISSKSIQLLKSVGMESIGDCLDFHKRGADALIQVPYGLLHAFETDILPYLREHGYLSNDEDTD